MMILAAILIALLFPLLIMGLSYSRLNAGFLWVMVLLGAFTAWILVLFAGKNLPIEITLVDWSPESLFGFSPALLVDTTVWPLAITVMTVTLAVLMTDVVYFRNLDPQVWASHLALGGVGLLAVLAGNPLSLLLAWAVLDVSELIWLLIRVRGSNERERVVVAFSVRVVGIYLLIAAMLRTQALGTILTFQAIPPEVTGLLLLSATLRLGVIPPVQPNLQKLYLQRGLGSLARLVPVVTSLPLSLRVAIVGVDDSWSLILLVFITITILYASIKWLRAENELLGRPYWILALAGFAVASAAYRLEGASFAWSFALFFSGAGLFLFSFRRRSLLIFPVLGIAGFCALPLTPAWEGVALFTVIPSGFRIALFIALAFLLLGYLKHAQPDDAGHEDFERWMWLVYPLGLFLMFGIHFGLAYLQRRHDQGFVSFSTPGWWYGTIPLAVAIILLVMNHRGALTTPSFFQEFAKNINLNFVSRFFWRVYRLIGSLITLFSKLLEGEGGVLWAILILMLLVVSLSFINTGDGFEF
jgi:hypothetical protein